VKPRIWTTRRKVLGNGIPFACGVAAVAIGYPSIGTWSFLPAWIITYMSLNAFGFFENAKIHRELTELGAKGELVGFVFDRPPSLLDAHAEVGMLQLSGKRLTVVTEDRAVEWLVSTITNVFERPNPHSFLGLGGWVQVDFVEGPSLKLESRARNTMRASRAETKRLYNQLKAKCPTRR
jgi:hypothetical protein